MRSFYMRQINSELPISHPSDERLRPDIIRETSTIIIDFLNRDSWGVIAVYRYSSPPSPPFFYGTMGFSRHTPYQDQEGYGRAMIECLVLSLQIRYEYRPCWSGLCSDVGFGWANESHSSLYWKPLEDRNDDNLALDHDLATTNMTTTRSDLRARRWTLLELFCSSAPPPSPV